MSNRQERGVKNYYNVHSGGERLRASPEVFIDYVSSPHVARHVVGALDWKILKVILKGGGAYPISWECLWLVWSVPLVRIL